MGLWFLTIFCYSSLYAVTTFERRFRAYTSWSLILLTCCNKWHMILAGHKNQQTIWLKHKSVWNGLVRKKGNHTTLGIVELLQGNISAFWFKSLLGPRRSYLLQWNLWGSREEDKWRERGIYMASKEKWKIDLLCALVKKWKVTFVLLDISHTSIFVGNENSYSLNTYNKTK